MDIAIIATDLALYFKWVPLPARLVDTTRRPHGEGAWPGGTWGSRQTARPGAPQSLHSPPRFLSWKGVWVEIDPEESTSLALHV